MYHGVEIEKDGFPAACSGESSISGTSFFVTKSPKAYTPYPGTVIAQTADVIWVRKE